MPSASEPMSSGENMISGARNRSGPMSITEPSGRVYDCNVLPLSSMASSFLGMIEILPWASLSWRTISRSAVVWKLYPHFRNSVIMCSVTSRPPMSMREIACGIANPS
eukprot:Amastigsp_a178372_206.p2 type:complete len:108 gc:universal Amastigsp_a178372_206:848-525(-)